MARNHFVALGLDFGTESVRALLVGLDGREHASAVAPYPHGQITQTLPLDRAPGTGAAAAKKLLPPDFALQDPQDWIDASARAVRAALRQARLSGDAIGSIGVAFTSCTMLPALRNGTPLCQVEGLRGEKFAWPKLWKHHGAKDQTQQINELARKRREPWLARYGGIVGVEWFFPKVLETLDHAPRVYRAAEVWLEGGDWYVWQLLDPAVVTAERLPRSTCQAGYKAQWNAKTGYPSREFFAALNPAMANVVRQKMPGRLAAPGTCVGVLGPTMARKLGLRACIPVSAAIIDAHAGVPGAGVAEAGTLVLVMGTSSCHMLNATEERLIPGVAGVVRDGILPGFYGYETGQAAVGDAFDWFRRMAGQSDFSELNRQAAALAPGAEGVLCMDWFNGCRTPLMDGRLTGAFTGLALGHGPAHLYRAVLEASAFGVRWIVEVLRGEAGDESRKAGKQESRRTGETGKAVARPCQGVPVKKFVAAGGLPHHNPLLVQIYADVLGQPITIHPSRQNVALGAAILGVLAAGEAKPGATGFASAPAAIRAMAQPHGRQRVVRPNRTAHRAYDGLYRRYRELAGTLASAAKSNA